MGRRKPAPDEPLHTLPLDASVLTPPFESTMPEVTDREAEVGQSIPIPRNSVIADVPAHDGPQPRAGFRHGGVHAPPQLGFHLAQLSLQPFEVALRSKAEWGSVPRSSRSLR